MRKGLLAVSALLTVTLSACAREHGEGGALAPGLTGDDPAFGPASTGQARDGGAPVAPSDAGPFVLPPLADAAAPDARAVDPRFADAVPIAGRALVDITEPEQTNHFTFDGAAGDYYELRTTRHTFSPDVAITLYDEAGTLLAQNDDGALWPGDAVDARLVVRLPRTGRYVVEVHDPSTPADFFGGGFALRYYTLSVQAVEAGTPGFRRADEGAATFVTDPESGYAYATVLGELRAGVELRVPFEGLPAHALIGHVLASGSAGNGSPSFPARVQVARADGALLASVQGNGERQPIYPPVDGGTHALAVRTASTATPGFFAIDLVLLPDNPREQHERENDQLSGAEPLVFTGAGRRRALLLADLAGGDFDTFRVDVTSGAQVFASCESESAGSGLLFPSASLLDASGQSLAVAALAEDGTLELGPVRVGNVDHVFLGLEAGILRDDVPVEPWMRCVVLTAP